MFKMSSSSYPHEETSHPHDRDSDDDSIPDLARSDSDDSDDEATMKMSQYNRLTKKKVRETELNTPSYAERIATGRMNSHGEYEYIYGYDPLNPDIPPSVEYVNPFTLPHVEEHSFANASPLSEHVSAAKPRVVLSGSHSIPPQPAVPQEPYKASVPYGISSVSHTPVTYGLPSTRAHVPVGVYSQAYGSVPVGASSQAYGSVPVGASSQAYGSVPVGMSTTHHASPQSQAYGQGYYYPQSLPTYPQGVHYTHQVPSTPNMSTSINPFDGIPFTHAEYQVQSLEHLRNMANGLWEANRGRDIRVEVNNIKSKAQHLLIASNVSSDMDSATAMNVVIEKVDQFLNANPELKSYTIFDIDLSMQSGLGYSIECEKRVKQQELNKLANLRDTTRDKMESDRENAEVQKEEATTASIKECADDRLTLPNVIAMSVKEFEDYFINDQADKHAKVDYYLKKKLANSDRVLEGIQYKVNKIRKALTILQYMNQLLDAYGFVLQALTVEVLNAIKPFLTIIQEVSVQVTHPFSRGSSINPYLEGRLSFIYQALFRGKEAKIGRTVSEFMGLTAAAKASDLARDPLQEFNQIVSYAQRLKQSGAMQYFLSLDTISLCLILCRFKDAPLPVTTGIFNIVNEYEKKRKQNPSAPVGEFEMVNAVREFLKLNTTVQEFKHNRFAGKEVVDLTHLPDRPAPKFPVKLNRPNENAYAAQAQAPAPVPAPAPVASNIMENRNRHVQTGTIGKHGNVKYYIGSRLVTYIALKSAQEICAKCANDAAPQDHHSPRCYTKQCIRCKYYGHSARHCYHKV